MTAKLVGRFRSNFVRLLVDMDLTGQWGWHVHIHVPKWAKKALKAAYQHIDVSVSACAFECYSLGFQGGHVYYMSGQRGFQTAGYNIGWNTQKYSNNSSSYGLGSGAKYGAYGQIGTSGSYRSRFAHGEYGVSLFPMGLAGGRGTTHTLLAF